MSGRLISPLALQQWHSDIAAADAADWITVAAYAGAALLSVRAAHRARLSRRDRERIFWRVTAVLLAFLGVNELFDLQMALTAIGKSLALSEGWYADRRSFQAIFIVCLGVAGLIAGAFMVWLARNAHRSVRWALLGHVFIAVFVLIRAASFHHADRILGMGPRHFNYGSMQEMAGILILAVAANSYAGHRRKPKRA